MTDCIIVGAGIIGMLSARALHDAGLEVCVLERSAAGRESSWAGGGILSPLYPWRYPAPVSRLARASQRVYPQLAETLARESGIDPEYRCSGLLMLDAGEQDRARAWAAEYDVRIELPAGDRIPALEPALAVREAGVLFPDVGQVRNPRLVRALRRSLEVRGIPVREHRTVEGIAVEDGRVRGVVTAEGVLPARAVVVAGGAWSAGLLAQTGIRLPVEPVRGQMILYRAEPGMLRHIVLHRGRYLIPRRDGRILFGSTLERVGFDKSTTAEARTSLCTDAESLLPALAGCRIEHHWAGLRPGSPAGVPFIGEHPGIRQLFVNTGHFRNGVVLAPASVQLLTELVLGHTPSLDPAPYRLPELAG